MAVCQAIQLKIYTTRSLKRDETAGYIRLVRATGEISPDTIMRDAEGDGLQSDRSPMISDTDVRNPVDDFSDRSDVLARAARRTVGSYPRLEAI
jgi:hypothetical protein